MSLQKKLEAVGLSPKEAMVYISLLELGEATVCQISVNANVNRITTYVILNSLLEKGCVSSYVKKKTRMFKIGNPANLVSYLEKEKCLVESKINQAQEMISQMDNLRNLTTERLKIKFYKGNDGIGMMQKRIANSKSKKIDNIYNINNANSNTSIFAKDFNNVLANHKYNIRSIITYDGKKTLPYTKKSKNVQRRFLPGDKFPFLTDFTLFDNKVGLVSIKKELMGIIIEDRSIVKGFKMLFDFAWQGCDRYQLI